MAADLVGTCSKCGRVVDILRLPSGLVADTHQGVGGTCSGSGTAPGGTLKVGS